MFPMTIAIGKSFCNRDAERALVRQHIEHGRHLVIVAPRRYGKSSLISQVILENELLSCMIDLTMAVTIQDVENVIVNNVSDALYKMLPKSEKAKQRILNLFSWLNPEITLTAAGQKLKLSPRQNTTNSVEGISSVLVNLNKAAGTANKKLVIVIDEFQQVAEIGEQKVEAAIRSAMQHSEHVVYIFSGSNRHLLSSIFNSKNRPFYNSCEIMKISKISKEEFYKFIQKAAIEKWSKKLPKKTLDLILEITGCYPSYVNRVCGYFWLTDSFPTTQLVRDYWENYIAGNEGLYKSEILSLSGNQRIVIKHLADTPTKHPSGSDFCRRVNMSEASVRQAVKKLETLDYIYIDDDKLYRVLDPALCEFLKGY